MKILLIGDASNYHATLATGLRTLGHTVTVASNGSRWMNTSRDIDLSRPLAGKAGGLVLWLRLNTVLRSRLKGYDLVLISNPVFLDLRPHRNRVIFDRLLRDNGRVCLTMLGTDSYYVDACVSANSPLRYNEWRVDGEPTPYANKNNTTEHDYLGPLLYEQCKHVYDNVHSVVSVLPEYHWTVKAMRPDVKLGYGGLPIDVDNIQYIGPKMRDGKLTIMQACHAGRELEKGALEMRRVLERVAARHPDKVRYQWLQNVPYAQFARTLEDADIVVDQLYSYSPATTALLAMAQGKVVISGGEPEYYDYIGETDLRPIINADPTNLSALAEDIERLINNPDLLNSLAHASRLFVERHHHPTTIARRFLQTCGE